MVTDIPAPLRERIRAVRLYVVTDADADAETVVRTVAAACCGGAECIQLRRKGGTDREVLDLAIRCREVTADYGALFVVDDRLDIAMASGADGVHLGQDDLPIAVARRLWPGHLVGRSTHSLEQVEQAVAEGADYLGVGPVFATPTKPGRPPVGVDLVARVAQAEIPVPWVAIGGIDLTTIDSVLAAGARGVAVVRAVSAAPDPEAAAAALHRRVAGVVESVAGGLR